MKSQKYVRFSRRIEHFLHHTVLFNVAYYNLLAAVYDAHVSFKRAVEIDFGNRFVVYIGNDKQPAFVNGFLVLFGAFFEHTTRQQ